MDVIAALIPSVCVGAVFWFVIRSIIRADRNERKALAELDRQEALRRKQLDRQGGTAAADRTAAPRDAAAS